MKFKEKLIRASGYNGIDFFNTENIGIIGRGPSVNRLDLCYKKFNHCYLTGEFNHTLYKIEKYISGKQIVLCLMQYDRYRTTEENCQKFNINNMQIERQVGTDKYEEYISKFTDLKVVGFTKKHYDIVRKINKGIFNEDLNFFSTGILGIISALYFNPKNIYIIGLDFYNKNVKPYFVKEDKDISNIGQIEDSIKYLRTGMIKNINSICNNFRDIDLYLYTTYRGIKSKDNLHVIYV